MSADGSGFRMLALAALAAIAPPGDEPELAWLAEQRAPFDRGRVAAVVAGALLRPGTEDRRLLALSEALGLEAVDLLVLALLASVELDLWTGRAIARLQAPVGGSRPTLALLGEVFAPLGATLPTLAASAAVRAGVVEVLLPESPLAERPLRVAAPLALGVRGARSLPPGVGDEVPEVMLPASIVEEAARHAAALQAPGRGVVLRSTAPQEGRAVAGRLAAAIGRRPVFLQADQPGLGAWLALTDAVPVYVVEPAPGERLRLMPPVGWRGPVIVVAGADGMVDVEGRSLWTWELAPPSPGERAQLWRSALGGDSALADTLAVDHVHGAWRIQSLGRLARHHADARGGGPVSRVDVEAALTGAEGTGLDELAQRLRDRVGDDALVVSPELRADLDHLVARCRGRDTLGDDLGPAVRARKRPGMRALFSGPPGTGKTLAVSWLATRLGLPLFRVDIAGVISKYIGETEKNLANLLARAEAAEVVLLFDEADALFARRTEVRSSNDRFANTQTNYLLQRLETWGGIAVLTTNSRSRLDEAFARRLDTVVEFAAPEAAERRALWEAHLGAGHGVGRADLNRLSAAAELSGGHIRNVVVAAAALAREAKRPITWPDIVRGLQLEYRKVGTRMPAMLELRA